LLKKYIKDNSSSFKTAGLIFLTSRIFILLLVLYFGYIQTPSYPEGSYIIDIPIIKDFVLYDSQHYINIAKYGYNNYDAYPKIQGQNYVKGAEAAFFPLYPMLIRMLFFIGIEAHVAGFIISNICFFFILFFLKKFLIQNGIKVNMPLYIVAFYPLSMYFSAVYTESLFILLTIMCFYFAHNKKWWAAGITSFFASLARNAGIFLSAFLFFEYLHSINFKIKNIKKEILTAGFPVLGLSSFLFFEQIKYNDFLKFYHVNFLECFGRERTTFLKFLIEDIIKGNIKDPIVFINMLICYLFTVVFIIMCFDKKIHLSYKIFTFGLMYISMGTLFKGWNGTFASLGYARYAMPCIPVFIYLGKSKKYLSFFVLGIFAAGLFFYTAAFVSKYFIA